MESELGIELENITVNYGITLTRELLDVGYSIDSDFAYHEDSQTVMCGFSWGDHYMGDLVFFNIMGTPSSTILHDKPIDLVLLDNFSFIPKEKDVDNPHVRESYQIKLSFHKKLMLTFMIHAIAIGLFVLIYTIPSFFSFVQNTSLNGVKGGIPLGVIIIAFPTILISLLWAPFGIKMAKFPAPKGNILKKINFALWILLNFFFSMVYLFAISYYFRV
ncbi:MAG: hypothetical protein LBU74_01055 [Methanobacteriaceae archaeon]|jgi:hypothetical protein|nr:hypothetical protein [Candidatus Methanorudis spinitermitis]